MKALAYRSVSGQAGWATGILVILASAATWGAAGAQARRIPLIWKQVTQVLLKENNRPVKTWNVYRPDKERNFVLVEVDRDWFIFNLKQRRLYRADKNDFQSQGDALTGPEPGRHTPTVKTEDWDSRDVGPAQQISVRISATGDVLTIEFPHPLAIY